MLVVSTDLWRGAGRGAAREHGRRGGEGLPGALAPGEELVELGADDVGQQHLLWRGLLARPLEDPKRQPTLGVPAVVEHVADVEREELVLAKSGPEGEAVDDVVTEPV